MRRVQHACLVGLMVGVGGAKAHGQTFAVDSSRQEGVPLVKTKFGVYQTPLTTLPHLLKSVPLLCEAGVRDLRYEIGWGKSEVLAFDQIGGTAQQPTYDFSMLDAFIGRLQQAKVKPLLAMGYCPNPLKTRTEWAGWKDVPSDLGMWQRINSNYARHLAGKGVAYEIWNEPDMPEPGGKMFFSGTASDYGQLYAGALVGIRQADLDAPVGGPAIAYDLNYLTPLLSQPMDFASIHGYANWQTQIGGMQRALKDRPEVPIYLTEYASFSNLPPNGPQSRSEGAAQFFEDAQGLLACSDVTKVYWAQWLDAGEAPGMGLITWDGHRKALFNALKIYNDLPVDRNAVSPENAEGIGLMASSEEHRAGVVLWNTSDGERTVTVNLNRLPFARGTLELWRIDREHASYVDNSASEQLAPLQKTPLSANSTVWSGSLPSHSVVYLRAVDGVHVKPLVTQPVGEFVRTYTSFPQREMNSQEFADFDEQTGTARLGVGRSDGAVSQIGVLVKNPVPKWRVQTSYPGDTLRNRHGILALLLEFQNDAGHPLGSVLYNSEASRLIESSWTAKGLTNNEVKIEKALGDGRPFEINLRRIAPSNWSRYRLIVTFVLQNIGGNSRAKFVLSKG